MVLVVYSDCVLAVWQNKGPSKTKPKTLQGLCKYACMMSSFCMLDCKICRCTAGTASGFGVRARWQEAHMLLFNDDGQQRQHGGDGEERQDEVVGAHVPD